MSDIDYVLCKQGVEDRDHLSCSCSFIKAVHQHMALFVQFAWPSSFSNVVHIMQNMCKRKKVNTCIIPMLWTKMLYHIWIQRNAHIFGGRF